MRANISIVLDKHDRPVVMALDDHDCLDIDSEEPWLAIDIAEGCSLIGPRDQVARWVADLHAAVGMA